MRRFHNIVRRTGVKPQRALEVGGVMGKGSLLRFPELAGAERFCLNLASMPSADGITSITGNANKMDMFEDDSFDLVLCCSTLEHDKHFWLSVAEMQRVMRPGALLVIGGRKPGGRDARMTAAEAVRGLRGALPSRA
jgi:SAM-dependent methyltransferase